MKPFFSIVVPCCDVEPYIEECLDSVMNQSFQDWECILYIETSKDRTEEIIRKKITGNPHFKVFSGPKTGACSTARNTGVDMAQGDYVIFLDSDDTIADGCLGRLHEKICANLGADLYPCAMIVNNEFDGKSLLRDNYGQDAPAEMNGVEATIYLGRRFPGGIYPMLQMSIHRREFLVEHDLKCIRGLRCQDSEFSPRALYLAKRVVPLHEPFYLYRIRPNSVQTKAKGVGYFMVLRRFLTGKTGDN